MGNHEHVRVEPRKRPESPQEEGGLDAGFRCHLGPRDDEGRPQHDAGKQEAGHFHLPVGYGANAG